MSVKLRHKRFPLIIVYQDPKESWDDFVEGKVLEEIRENGFNNFVIIAEDKLEDENESR